MLLGQYREECSGEKLGDDRNGIIIQIQDLLSKYTRYLDIYMQILWVSTIDCSMNLQGIGPS